VLANTEVLRYYSCIGRNVPDAAASPRPVAISIQTRQGKRPACSANLILHPCMLLVRRSRSRHREQAARSGPVDMNSQARCAHVTVAPSEYGVALDGSARLSAGWSLGLVEELVADGPQLWVDVSDGQHRPLGVLGEPVSGGLRGGEKAARVAGGGTTRVVSISWDPGIEITAVAGERSVTPACGSTVTRTTVSVVGHRDSIRAGRPRIAGSSRVSAAHQV
jgi:hypothetical protein